MEISQKNNKKHLNKHIDTLIEGTLKENSNILIGRGKFQAPEVDGKILMETNGKLSEVVNTIQMVEITGWDVYDLYGKLPQ